MSIVSSATPASLYLDATLRQWFHELCDTPTNFDAQLSLMELGMDSVRLLSFLEKVKRLGLVINFTEALECPTFAELIALIEARVTHVAPNLMQEREQLTV